MHETSNGCEGKSSNDVNKTMTLLSKRVKASTIYASAIALVAAAMIGTAAVDPRLARAVDVSEPTMQQKLPSFAPLVDQVKSAVVSIRVKADEPAIATFNFNGPGGDEANPFEGTPFEHFFNGPNSPFRQFRGPGNGHRLVMAQGSGFFISADGYLVTNNHVAGDAVSVEVLTNDGKSYSAKVVGTDPKTDLALLKVDGGNDFPYVKFAHGEVRVGDWVVAMGNPFGLGGTVTAGIVSARGRDIGEGPYDDFLQIDAPVNKGNSGGPTFNQDGQVVGVNTAIYSPSGGSVGIAFDIPAATVERVVAQLKAHGHVTRGWLGVQVQPLTPDLADSLGLKNATGALVAEPQSGSPAEKAGLKAGDVILSVNGEQVKDARDLARKIADLAPGTDVKLRIQRNGSEETMNLKIGEMPEKRTARADTAPERHGAGVAQLGMRVAPASEVTESEDSGLAVVAVEPGGKAQEAGLSQGDIILKVGNTAVNRADDLRKALKEASDAGRNHATALVKHDGSQRFIALPTSVG